MKSTMLDGIVVVNKPSGMTSHDVVRIARKKFDMKRVGHAGTLDPSATGVLVILLGKSTKLFAKFEGFDKTYYATVRLGVKTHSADIQGAVVQERSALDVTKDQLEEAVRKFQGDIEQIPPMVSAIKIKGQRLYQLARQGIEVKREPRKIRIDKIEVVAINLPDVKIYMECSKGTYVRKVAEDIGDALNCGACATGIYRTRVGPFTIDDAVTLDEMNETHVRSWED